MIAAQASVARAQQVTLAAQARTNATAFRAQYAPYMTWPRGTFSLKLRDQVSSKPLEIEAIASYDLFFRIERVR
jgi:hypothetical protein